MKQTTTTQCYLNVKIITLHRLDNIMLHYRVSPWHRTDPLFLAASTRRSVVRIAGAAVVVGRAVVVAVVVATIAVGV